MQPFPALFGAEKTISAFPGWAEPETETQYIWFDVPLEIGGVTERGFLLHGGCYRNRPDCNVSFELRIGKQPGRKCLPLARLDWRSLEGGHLNPRRDGVEGSGRTVSNTHLHAFDLNWLPESGRMRRGNVRFARELDQELQTFEEVRGFAGNYFRISNIGIVSTPPWEYDLLARL